MLNGHGDDIMEYGDIRLNFSSNVYTRFEHTGLFRHLSQSLSHISNYPEVNASSLACRIAEYNGVGHDEVIVTNGATEAIYLIAQAFRQSRSTILQPTFSEYADACRMAEHEVVNIKALSDFRYEQGKTNLLWICNPNNPTGRYIDQKEINAIMRENPQLVCVIDASYAPFVDTTKVGGDVEFPDRTICLHSMTKEYAIPGLRLGYAISYRTLISRMAERRMPWSVNQLAIEAGFYLLDHADDYKIDVESLLNESKRVTSVLSSECDIYVEQSDTHILLCRLREHTAAELKDYLARKHGILIRDASNFVGLTPHHFRIAVQDREQNDVLLNTIKEFLNR